MVGGLVITLDLRLLRNRPFTAVLVALVFAGIAWGPPVVSKPKTTLRTEG